MAYNIYPGKTTFQSIQDLYKKLFSFQNAWYDLAQESLFETVGSAEAYGLEIPYLPETTFIRSVYLDYGNLLLHHLDEQILFDLFRYCPCLLFYPYIHTIDICQ